MPEALFVIIQNGSNHGKSRIIFFNDKVLSLEMAWMD
jgi:hypothetical protein